MDDASLLDALAEAWSTQVTPEGQRWFYDPVTGVWRDEAGTLHNYKGRKAAQAILGDWEDVRALNLYERSRGL